MDEQVATTPKKTIRVKKTAPLQSATILQNTQPVNAVNFDELVTRILQSKQEFDSLQKEIAQIKQDWVREQKQHEIEIAREQETYQYNTSLTRKRAEDEFQDKKLAWEKDLAQRKQQLEDQRVELEQLRKLSDGFSKEEEQAVKEAEELLAKQLTEKFNQEKILRDQEVKAEKDLLNMKISNLETDNSRLIKETEVLKRSLDEAARQVKEIAVKVIESGQPKTQTNSES